MRTIPPQLRPTNPFKAAPQRCIGTSHCHTCIASHHPPTGKHTVVNPSLHVTLENHASQWRSGRDATGSEVSRASLKAYKTYPMIGKQLFLKHQVLSSIQILYTSLHPFPELKLQTGGNTWNCSADFSLSSNHEHHAVIATKGQQDLFMQKKNTRQIRILENHASFKELCSVH